MLSFKEKSSVQCGTTNEAITKGCPYFLPIISTKVVSPSSRIFSKRRFTNNAFHASQQNTPYWTPTKSTRSHLSWISNFIRLEAHTQRSPCSPLDKKRGSRYLHRHQNHHHPGRLVQLRLHFPGGGPTSSFNPLDPETKSHFKEHQSLVVITRFSNLHPPIISWGQIPKFYL